MMKVSKGITDTFIQGRGNCSEVREGGEVLVPAFAKKHPPQKKNHNPEQLKVMYLHTRMHN